MELIFNGDSLGNMVWGGARDPQIGEHVIVDGQRYRIDGIEYRTDEPDRHGLRTGKPYAILTPVTG